MNFFGLEIGNKNLTANDRRGIRLGWRLAPLFGTTAWILTGHLILAVRDVPAKGHESWYALDFQWFLLCLFFAYGSLLFAVPFVYCLKRWKVQNLASYLLAAFATAILTAAVSIVGLVFLAVNFTAVIVWAFYCGLFMWLFAEYFPRRHTRKA